MQRKQKKKILGERAHWVIGDNITLPVYIQRGAKQQKIRFLAQELLSYMPASPFSVCIDLWREYRFITRDPSSQIIGEYAKFQDAGIVFDDMHCRRAFDFAELIEPAMKLVRMSPEVQMCSTSGLRTLRELGISIATWCEAWRNFFDENTIENARFVDSPGDTMEMTRRFVSQWTTTGECEKSLPVKYCPATATSVILPDCVSVNYIEQSFTVDLPVADNPMRDAVLTGLVSAMDVWLDSNIRNDTTTIHLSRGDSTAAFTILSSDLAYNDMLLMAGRIARMIMEMCGMMTVYMSRVNEGLSGDKGD